MTGLPTACSRLCLGLSAKVASVVALIGCLGLQAAAGPLATTPLAFNDGAGPDGGIWRGSVDISGGPTLGNQFSATIDYAVFPPGRFGQYLSDNGFSGSDPAPTNAIYAYQISSVTSATPGIGQLSVGFDSGDLSNLVTSVATGVSGEVSPTSSANQLTSAFWSFSGGAIGAGGISSLLVIASPSQPELDTIQLASGLANPNTINLVASLTDSIGVFEEVPEPAAASLLAVIATCLVSQRVTSRR